jgi:hypothetical protein
LQWATVAAGERRRLGGNAARHLAPGGLRGVAGGLEGGGEPPQGPLGQQAQMPQADVEVAADRQQVGDDVGQRATISLNGVDGSTVTTSVVITSRSRLVFIGPPRFDAATGPRCMCVPRQPRLAHIKYCFTCSHVNEVLLSTWKLARSDDAE